MKDLLRLLVYGGSALLVIGLLSLLATRDLVSPDMLIALSVLLVVVLPVILGIMLARRERMQRDNSPE